MDINEDERKLCNQLRERTADLKITDSFRIKDYNMIRFLRARNLDMDKAEEMFRKYIEWRTENDLDNALNWEVPRDLVENFNYKVTGLNREGGLVICLNVAEWDPAVTQGRYDELMRFAYHEVETLTFYAKYFTMKSGTYGKMVGLINLEGLTFTQCSTVEWIRALITLLKAFEAYYPETLKAAFLINAPWVFSILWSIAKPFISNSTHQRLRFLGADKEVWKEEISQFVEEDQFPVSFGGQLPEDYRLVMEDDKVVGKRVAPASATDAKDGAEDNENGNESGKPKAAEESIELD